MYLVTVYTPEDQIAMSCLYPTQEEAHAKREEIENNLPFDGWVVTVRQY